MKSDTQLYSTHHGKLITALSLRQFHCCETREFRGPFLLWSGPTFNPPDRSVQGRANWRPSFCIPFFSGRMTEPPASCHASQTHTSRRPSQMERRSFVVHDVADCEVADKDIRIRGEPTLVVPESKDDGVSGPTWLRHGSFQSKADRHRGAYHFKHVFGPRSRSPPHHQCPRISPGSQGASWQASRSETDPLTRHQQPRTYRRARQSLTQWNWEPRKSRLARPSGEVRGHLFGLLDR